jgi:hypothetical protein
MRIENGCLYLRTDAGYFRERRGHPSGRDAVVKLLTENEYSHVMNNTIREVELCSDECVTIVRRRVTDIITEGYVSGHSLVVFVFESVKTNAK